ncbi:hypothetical protein [Amycolatopsis sp.]|uniref:hypothetical protein n=1 Tax=Amycolatopsis sp. TaxID=37632 RepID=UPI002CF205C1|nr:hypothetical protein [Amycolatopsis sp.]HVV13321.1 hypothetical protein [Amycolatopsis sp.]
MLVGNTGLAEHTGLSEHTGFAEPAGLSEPAGPGGTLAVVPARRPETPWQPAPQRFKPFIVVGRVNGREECARAASPDEALTRMIEWLHADEDAAAVWYLREDWPEPVTVVGRLLRGVVGESRRCAHLFTLDPGTVLYGSLTACCGTEIALSQLEWLRPGAGMPCECCLALSPGLAA